MSEKRNLKNLLPRNRILLVLLAALGCGLIILAGFSGGDEEPNKTEYTDVGFYTEYLERRICDLCKSINGITEATVFLTLDCSSEFIYETEGDGASDFLILTGKDGEYAVMLCEIYPRVRGIAVVCTGGDLPRIQQSVTELLSASLGISSGKIKVVGS
ncbi:MAG: hypothetical protein E7672_05690 [Ruminococcaceae bacterium]|nr:hypothetical protein [Oscillospiraceae bacterium]